MTKRQITKKLMTGLKITASVFVFTGLTLALSDNAEFLLFSYLALFTGTILFMVHSYKVNDHMLLLLSVTGFTLTGNLFLDTETALMIADAYGIALTEEQGWFAQYGNVLLSIIKELV